MKINTDKYLNRIKEIIIGNINRDITSVFLFGSRTGECSLSSDVDVGLLSSAVIDKKAISRMKNDIEESDVPFHVDIVDFSEVSSYFKKTAMEKIIIWNKGRFLN